MKLQSLWLIVISVTVTALACFIIAQHHIRSSADDPQEFLSQEIARKLSQGEPIQKNWLGRRKTVELSLDSRLFYIIFNSQGQIATTSALLNGQIPELPKGVLDTAENKGVNKVTWQPAPGVREAIVVRPFKSSYQSGFILAGQSLDRFEELTRILGVYLFIAWMVFVSLASILAIIFKSHKKTAPKTRTK